MNKRLFRYLKNKQNTRRIKPLTIDEAHEIADEIERLNNIIEKATKDLFELKDMIYKPETRDENIPIQQKISSIIKQLNGRSDE